MMKGAQIQEKCEGPAFSGKPVDPTSIPATTFVQRGDLECQRMRFVLRRLQ
jgi:hypothetical protein